MQNLITSFKVSLENFKKLRVLTVASMLVALTVILGFMVIYIGPSIKISFAFIPVTAGSMLFGPVVGAVIGALGDIVGFFIKPVGPYTPFLTISCALSGIIYGMFLFNKEASWKNVIISQLIVTIFINLLLDTYWLTILFGNGFMALLPMRALKSVIFFPVQVVLIYDMAKYAPVFKKKFNY